MTDTEQPNEPDWDLPLEITLTPALLINALFPSAESVHTGWRSCVEPGLTVADISAMDERNGNYCRLAEQEFVEEGEEELVWHDWAVELRIGEVLLAGHWYAQAGASAMEWEWSAREAQKAFEKACVLFGRRVGHGIAVEEPAMGAQPPRGRHH